MAKVLKTLVAVAISIVILLIATTFVLSKVINPNDYKARIQTFVYEKTGQKLTIEGQLKWSLFPSLQIHIPAVTLGNPENASGTKLAKIKSLDIKVKLLPLFSKQIQVEALKLIGAEINLVTNEKGQSNWGFRSTSNSHVAPSTPKSLKRTQKQTTLTKNTAQAASLTSGALTANYIQIEKGRLNLINEQTNTTDTFNNINLKSTAINTRNKLSMQLSFEHQGNKSNTKLRTILTSTVVIDSTTGVISMPDLKIKNTLLRANLPDLVASTSGKLTANLNKRTLTLEDAATNIAGTNITHNLSLQQQSADPIYKAFIEIKNAQLQPLLKSLYGKGFASGLLNIQSNVTARGSSTDEIKQSLNGDGKLSISNGAIHGIDVSYLLNQAAAYLDKQPTAPKQAQGPQKTRFTTLTASYNITDGSLTNQDLKMVSPAFTTTGKGTIDLIAGQWQRYELTTSREQNKDFSLPIIITGPLNKPHITPDYKSIAKNLLKNQVQQYFDKDTQGIGNKLKGLFN